MNRILMVIPYFVPETVFGGAVTYAYYISKEQIKRGSQLTILTTNILTKHQKISCGEEFVDGIDVKRHRIYVGFMSYWFTPTIIKDLLNMDYDIVHAHCFGNFQTDMASLIAKIRQKPLVITMHGVFYPDNLLTRLIYGVYSNTIGNLAKGADAIIVASNFEKEICQRWKIDKERIKVIPHGIDPGEFTQNKDGTLKYQLGIEGKMILYVGRIARVKGLNILIKSMALIAKEVDDAYLVLAGEDYDCRKELEALRDNLGLTHRVIFTGGKPKKDVINAYRSADVTVLPSEYESFGLVLLESGICGTPVVATRVGGIPEIVKDGETGILVDYGDVEQLATAILTLLRDEDLKNRMGTNASEYVSDNFAWSRVVDEIEKVYDECISRV